METSVNVWDAMERVNLGVAEAEDYAAIRADREAMERKTMRADLIEAGCLLVVLAVIVFFL